MYTIATTITTANGKTITVGRLDGEWKFTVEDFKGNSIEGTRRSKDAAIKAGTHFASKGW